MSTNVTSKGQVTIPKRIREHLGVQPGTAVEFKVAMDGNIVLTRADGAPPPSRFAALRGRLNLGMSTDEYMALIRGGDDD